MADTGGGFGYGAWGYSPYGGTPALVGESYSDSLAETLILDEDLNVQLGAIEIEITEGQNISATLPVALRFDQIQNFQRYALTLLREGDGVLPTIQRIAPTYTVLASGTAGETVDAGDLYVTRELSLDDFVDSSWVNNYIEISNGPNAGRYRIVSVLVTGPPGVVVVERDLVLSDSTSGSMVWEITTAVTGVSLVVSKATEGSSLQLALSGLWMANGQPFNSYGTFEAAVVPSPRVFEATAQDNGVLLVEFNEPMRSENDLVDPADYSITGPTTVRVKRAWAVDDATVALETVGLTSGSYTLEVNASGTPKDIAGNPIDPLFNQAIFTSSPPLTTRSIFTDKGPITKPVETLDSGINAVLETETEATLPGATLTSSYVGKEVTLSGGAINGGTFLVTAVVSSTRVRLKASFTLPDPASGSLAWALIDSHHGEIADDPADVTVRVNAAPVTPAAVIGLQGQIVLNAAPGPTDDVEIDYSHICNPVVEIRRLNSKEFRLNAWNRDRGYVPDGSQHKYRYNNILVSPSDYDPDDMQASLDQPWLRELHYRAYERAYTPVLNEPNLLLLNTPIHRIAYPPASRTLVEEFVRYEALVLPENHLSYPWVRHGTGIASVAAGILTVQDASSGEFPTGQPVFWTREVDLTFPHVFASSWRFTLTAVTEPEGVFTGVASGFSDELVSVVVGFLEDGGVKKIGLLKRGATDPGDIDSWAGGLDSSGNPTGLPAEFDWSTLHTYRLFRDQTGTVKTYVDGDVIETLRLTVVDLPFLADVPSPFDTLQGAFFGSISRPARNTSEWDFVGYLVSPTSPQQTAPSSFVSYEANVLPENDARPWTPVGYHGTSTILGTDFLLLESTSATDAAASSEAGLVGGDFKGYLRMEPLLSSASEFSVDAKVALFTMTHGPDPHGLMLAVDDGSKVVQLSLVTDVATPLMSYGGRAFPEDFTPYIWTAMGGQTAEMLGRILRITDASATDGLVYYTQDTAPSASDDRVVSSTLDYILEARLKVDSYTVDGSGFAGAFGQVFEDLRSVGFMLTEDTGTKYIAFHSDGVPLGPTARWAFNWGDGAFHTYRLRKSVSGNVVTLTVDGVAVGSAPYTDFASPGADPIGILSFGSSTPASSAAESVVDWSYCNAFRVPTTQKRYVGLWKGPRTGTLADYHLALKVDGKGAQVSAANKIIDNSVNFVALGVVSGDPVIIDDGTNQGVYKIGTVGANFITLDALSPTFPVFPTLVDYRIPEETDWSVEHKYRILRDTTGQVSVLLDAVAAPLIQADYNSLNFPSRSDSLTSIVSGGVPAMVFGSFSPEHLEQSYWDYVRYGITLAPQEQRIVPHHQVINQWNVMSSPERLRTTLPHELTDFKSSSTGIVPKKDPDFLADPGLAAYTQLNEDTALVPLTQTFETQAPYPTQEFVSGLNRPEDVLNSDGDFVLNDGAIRYRLIVPDDILYSSLDVIEQTSGRVSLIKPVCDGCQPNISGLNYTDNVCLPYEGDVLPEDDTSAPTPWALVSDNPAEVQASVLAGILTYGTTPTGTKTVYRNDSPLPDAPGLQSEATFRIKLLNDATGGTGDSQVRFGMSAPGLTVALAFITEATGERRVVVFDLNSGMPVGATTFDFLDGSFHTYRIVRDPSASEVRIFIDS